MRIKKKDVILEAKLIDTSGEFTTQEKRMLKTLFKKFGPGGYNSGYDRWDGATFLIEEMGLSYDLAYDLSLTHWWHGDKLFQEVDPIYKKEDRGYLFNRIIRQLLTPYVEGRGERIADVSITWKDTNHLVSPDDTFVVTDDVTLWDGYGGFTLYIPFNKDRVGGNHVEYALRTENTIMVYIKIEEYEKDNPKENTHVNVFVEYGVGDRDEGREKKTLMKFDVPMPIPLHKESMYKVFTDVLKDILEKIESMTFTIKPYIKAEPDPE